MSTTTLPRSVSSGTDAPEVKRITVFGDFNCPWSYLAFRRAEVLAGAGIELDWRAVEHLPELPHGRTTAPFAGLRDELDQLARLLLPGEEFPHELPGFLPRTAAAVAAYAEGHAARSAVSVARVLFDSYWMRGVDIGDVYVLRTLLADQLRDSASPSRPVREWGAPVAVTGGPISAQAYRLIKDWSTEWREIGRQMVPVLHVRGDAEPLRGIAAVDWLGDRITALGLATDQPATPAPHCWNGTLPDLQWASADGGRWHRRFQRCSAR